METLNLKFQSNPIYYLKCFFVTSSTLFLFSSSLAEAPASNLSMCLGKRHIKGCFQCFPEFLQSFKINQRIVLIDVAIKHILHHWFIFPTMIFQIQRQKSYGCDIRTAQSESDGLFHKKSLQHLFADSFWMWRAMNAAYFLAAQNRSIDDFGHWSLSEFGATIL